MKKAVVFGAFAFSCALFVGCVSNPSTKAGAGPREPVIPKETVEESGELMGTQQSFMTDLNRTDSEQAGARHEADQPLEPGKEER